jgi:hypothetical protein
MVDRLPDDRSLPIFDIKSTSRSANPISYERVLLDNYMLQSAMYPEGEHVITGGPKREMRFIVVEVDPPYGISVMSMGPVACMQANEDYAMAVNVWADCTRKNSWPLYPNAIHYAEPSSFAVERKQANRMATHGFIRLDGEPVR